MNDGKRTYEWEAGRRLKMMNIWSDPAEGIQDGYDADSETTLKLQCTNGNLLTDDVTGTVISAIVYRRGEEVTDTYAASAFSWTRNSGDAATDAIWNAAHSGMKSVDITADELTADVQVCCTLTSTSPSYGTVDVDSQMMANHTRSEADLNDTLYIEDGILYVTAAENNYRLSGSDLTAVYPQLNGTLTASAWVYHEQPTKTVEFAYNASGLRVQKKVLTNNGKSVIANYTLHGKLITNLLMWCEDEYGNETEQDIHFFYDAQSRPAFAEYDFIKYRYLHNLQGDIVGIVDNNGNLVVEYKYDAWGRLISITGSMADTLGRYNPFRYRGYVYDEETGLYYLRSRYYDPAVGRFVNADCTCGNVGQLISHSTFTYCSNAPIDQADYSGKAGGRISSVMEPLIRNIINAICGREHASGSGNFSVKSVKRNITITKKEADKHNSAISDFVGKIAFAFGMVIGAYVKKTPHPFSKIGDSAVGGYLSGKLSDSVQDFFVDAFTVRPGTYTSIKCQYEYSYKILFADYVEINSYELRIYPDYCEVWYSYLNSGNGTITPQQNLGGMTLTELKVALGGK